MNSIPPTTRIGFFGLGLMGAGMAQRLLDAGYPLTVYNRDPAKTVPFAAAARLSRPPRVKPRSGPRC